MLKMAHFIEWPEHSDIYQKDSRFTFCIQNSNNLHASLVKWAKTGTIKNKAVEFQFINNDLSNLDGCTVLYFTDNRNLQAFLQSAIDEHVLTISDVPGNAQRGVIVNFISKDEKLRFEINLDVAKRQGFIISPRLLRLATIVGENK